MMQVQNLDSATFSEKYSEDENAVLIDVRTEGEFMQGHIPDSMLIDIYSPNFANEILSLDRDKNYYLYCRSGNRSYHAGVFMLNNGFKTVYNLADGILDWHKPLKQSF